MKMLGGEIEDVARVRQVPNMSKHPFVIESPVPGLDFVSGHSHLANGPYSWWLNRPGDWCLSVTLDGKGEILFADVEILTTRGSVTLVPPNNPRIFQVPDS